MFRCRPLAVLLVLLMSPLGALHSAEYFVSLEGRDENNGTAREQAFRTIQKGLDTMQAGDTLTILPGEYFGNVRRENLGNKEVETLIRADLPGTVVIRGDVPAPPFALVEGSRFIYGADFDQPAQAVLKPDSLDILEPVPQKSDLEFMPGRSFYDAEAKRLYLSPPDLRAPEAGRYTVSVVKNHGLFLHEPVRVVVDGLVFSGFSGNGLLLGSPTNCVVRNCTAYLNSNGLVANSGFFERYQVSEEGLPEYRSQVLKREVGVGPGGNVIEFSRAYGNYSERDGSGGNIVIFNSFGDTIRNSEAFRSLTHGIRHYGAISGPAILLDNLSWGNTENDLHIKGGEAPKFSLVERCITLGPMHATHVSHSIIGAENRYDSNPSRDNIFYDVEAYEIRDREFADPDNHDFHLQSTSIFRAAAPDGSDRGPFPYQANIFYVTPDGNDEADGLSLANAWSTLAKALPGLKPGDTLYLAPGEYDLKIETSLGKAGAKPIHIRGRGTEPVILRGGLTLKDSHGIEFRRLRFLDPVVAAGGSNLRFDNCALPHLEGTGVDGLDLRHCVWTQADKPALDLKTCHNVDLAGNVFAKTPSGAIRLDQADAVRYSDYNSYGSDEVVWTVGSGPVSLEKVRAQSHDLYSRVAVPEFQLENGAPILANPGTFLVGGPQGTPLGIYTMIVDREPRLFGPEVYSATSTTANLEWWTAPLSRSVFEWSEAGGKWTTVEVNSDGYAGYSLTGLKPDTAYEVRITAVAELESQKSFFVNITRTPLEKSLLSTPATVKFRTAASDRAPVTFYVAPDGKDSNEGRSRDSAFQSVQHAADLANPGDTILIAGGEYEGTVRIRNTGTPDKPITFRAIAGEKVLFHGAGKFLPRAFVTMGKNHIRFADLRFSEYYDSAGQTSGIFVLNQSNGIEIERCFYNGSTVGYAPSFVMAKESKDLLVRNCVMMGVFNGTITLFRCPDAVIEHSVFARPRILQGTWVNNADEFITLRNNIITDNQPTKVIVPLLEISDARFLREENNCFYMRLPADQRKVAMLYDAKAYERTIPGFGLNPVEASELPDTLLKVTLADLQKKTGSTTSIAANPQFRGAADLGQVDKDGKPLFMADVLLTKKDADFADYFATDPEMIRREIGLQPKAFQ